MKTQTEIYNLIILDESGSMCGVTDATIEGCNKTLNGIRSFQQEFGETHKNYVSIYAFQSNRRIPSRYLVKNESIEKVENINKDLYNPQGGTPLLDAVGSTLSDLKSLVKDKPLAIGNVTIITDGYENSSVQYTYQKVVAMIDELKEMGWTFAFMGADIDVAQASRQLNIDNYRRFEKTSAGVDAMFSEEMEYRKNWARRNEKIIAEMGDVDLCKSENRKSLFDRLKKSAKDYFSDKTDE